MARFLRGKVVRRDRGGAVVSRFGSYLSAQKLAKALLIEAEIKSKKGEPGAALIYTMRAVRELMTAMNNVASIAFHKKPRKKTKGVTPMKKTITKIAPAALALMLFVGSAGAWEFERNPDRFISVGLTMQRTALNGDSATALPNGVHAASTDNEVRARAIGADVRIPVHQSLTFSVSYERLNQETRSTGFDNLGGHAYNDGNDQSGQRYGASVRYYFNK